MFLKIYNSFCKRFQILSGQLIFCNSSIILQSPDSCNQNYCIRFKTCHAALDIHEFLSAKVRTEAGFGDGNVTQLQGHPCGAHAVAAVGDVCERSAVHKSRCVLQSLDKIGLNGVLQKRCHGSCGVEIICCYRLPFEIVGYDDPSQPFF